MQLNPKYAIFLFASSHLAIAGELVVKDKFNNARLIPLPPEVSAGCGMVLRIPFQDLPAVKRYMDEKAVVYDSIYELTVHDNERITKRIKEV